MHTDDDFPVLPSDSIVVRKPNDIENVKEIQIDCDWTASTKDAYFGLSYYDTVAWQYGEIIICMHDTYEFSFSE